MSLKRVSYVVCAAVGLSTAAIIALNAPPPPAEAPIAAPATLPAVLPPPRPLAIVPTQAPTPNPGIDFVWQALKGQLAPAKIIPEPPFPALVEQIELRSRYVDPSLSARLAPPEIRSAPRPLRRTGSATLRPRAGNDMAECALLPDAGGPPRPDFKVGPRYAEESVPQPNPLLRMPIVIRPRPEPLGLSANPALDDRARPPLAATAPLRTGGAPLMKPSGPDPLAIESTTKVANPPADDDPPASALGLPPRPPLK